MLKQFQFYLILIIGVIPIIFFIQPQLPKKIPVEPVFLLVSTAVYVLLILKKRGWFDTSHTEVGLLFFVMIFLAKSIYTNGFETSLTPKLLFTIVAYIVCKYLLSSKPRINYLITGHVFIAAFVFYIGFAIWQITVNNHIEVFYPNNSIFGILLAAQLVFIIPLYSGNSSCLRPVLKWFVNILSAAVIILLIYLKARAGILGLAAGSYFILYKKCSKEKIKKTMLLAAIPVFISVSSLFYLLKPGSSQGRILVYKAGYSLLKKHWLGGIGPGQFKVKYPQAQSFYFSQNNINSKEALLADNTVYAFNDLYQFLLENGIIGFSVLIILMAVFVQRIKNTVTTKENTIFFTAAAASLICIFTCSLFSYPLQVFPVILQVVYCAALINLYPEKKHSILKFSPAKPSVLYMARLCFGVVSILYFLLLLKYKIDCNGTFESERKGNRLEASIKYHHLCNSFITDGTVLYQYARELYYSNKPKEARKFLTDAKKLFSSNEVYKLSASIEYDLHNYFQAEKDYKTAVYMVPNRMMSRKVLMDFYIERKDTLNALRWAKSILEMPVKVPSEITYNTQQQTRETIRKLTSTTQ